MLTQYIEKVKSWAENNKADLIVAVTVLLVSVVSFGLGRLSVIWPEKKPIVIEQNGQVAGVGESRLLNQDVGRKDAPPLDQEQNSDQRGKFVASKNGQSYHYPWCAGALRIKEENKVWFQNKEEAEKAGYKPAENCPGL